jgi:amino acid permease
MAPLMELDVSSEPEASTSSLPGCANSDHEGKHSHALQGVLGSVWNLLNDIIGAPIVTVPYFVAICGWSLGLILLFAYSAISFTTLVIQHKLARIVHATSFEELCGMAFGRLGLGVAYVSVFMYNFGGFVAGLLVISASLVTLLVIQPCSEPLRCVHRASP